MKHPRNVAIELRAQLCQEILARKGMWAKIEGLRNLETALGLKAVPKLTRWSVKAQDELGRKDYLESYCTVEAGLQCLLDLPSSRFFLE